MPTTQWRTAIIGFSSVLYCALNVMLMKMYPKQRVLGLRLPTVLNITTLKDEGEILLGLPPFKSYSLTLEDFTSMIPSWLPSWLWVLLSRTPSRRVSKIVLWPVISNSLPKTLRPRRVKTGKTARVEQRRVAVVAAGVVATAILP